HEGQRDEKAESQVEEEQEEDDGHGLPTMASMARRSGEAGPNGSHAVPRRGQPRASRWAATSSRERARRPGTQAAAVRQWAQYPWPDMKPAVSASASRSAARARPPSTADRTSASRAVPTVHGGHCPHDSRSKNAASDAATVIGQTAAPTTRTAAVPRAEPAALRAS